MGFILKLDRTLPNFRFEIISFNESTNNIEFEIIGGSPTYNVVFTDQSDNVLGSINGYTYINGGIKNEVLDAGFGVSTIIGTVTDNDNNQLNDTIGVNFTTTSTQFQPTVTQINNVNLKFGGFISNLTGKYGDVTPTFNETALDQVRTLNDLIIDTTINKLELLDYEDNFKYELDVDFSVNIQYDGMLASGESVDILIPRIRLILPLNTFRKTATTFQPQFAVTSWRMYNVDSVAYELNTISVDNNGVTFSANGRIELNIENPTIPFIDNSIDSINQANNNATIRLTRSVDTSASLDVLASSIHSNSNIATNTINFTVGQTSKTFTYTPNNGLDNGFYIANLLRISNNSVPSYLLNSGDIGFTEQQYVETTQAPTTTPTTAPTTSAPPFTLTNVSRNGSDISFTLNGGTPNYDVFITNQDGDLMTRNQLTYTSNGTKTQSVLISSTVTQINVNAIDQNGLTDNGSITVEQIPCPSNNNVSVNVTTDTEGSGEYIITVQLVNGVSYSNTNIVVTDSSGGIINRDTNNISDFIITYTLPPTTNDLYTVEATRSGCPDYSISVQVGGGGGGIEPPSIGS